MPPIPASPSINHPNVLFVADGATPSFLITMHGRSLTGVLLDGHPVTATNNGDGTYTYNFTPVHANHALLIEYSIGA
jgi:hypothetical protein